MSRFLFAFSLLAAVTVATPSFAQWSNSERDEFSRDCLDACRKNPNVSDNRKGQCVDYCACVQSGSEQTEPNYRLLNQDFQSGKDTDRVRAVKGLVPNCNRKAFQ